MRRPFYRHAAMPLQRFLADPARGDGYTADGMAGDCYRTALAGALGRPRDTVPHFVNMPTVDAEWWWELQRWTREEYGRCVYGWQPDKWLEHRAAPETRYPGGRPYVVVSGPSPRGPFHHAVVADLDLNIVHDPHPLGMGLTRIDLVDVLLEADWPPPPRRALEALTAHRNRQEPTP